MLASYGFDAGATELVARADLRFSGQEYTITVPVEAAWLDDAGALLGGIRERFVAAHRQLYGHGDADAPLEVVAAGSARSVSSRRHAGRSGR